MSFTVVDCEQRTPEWYAARVGILTATGAAAMLSLPRKKGEKETAGRANLRQRLAMEQVSGIALDEDRFVSNAMQRGAEREAEAVAVYETRTGNLVQPVGFIRHNLLPIGCSPDGIVGDFEGGLELKCPIPTTHWDYLAGMKLPSEYRAQVTHSLFVTGLPWWDFVSYCPDFHGELKPLRFFRVRVKREDVDLAAYALAVSLFLGEVEALKDQMRGRAAQEDTNGV